MVRTLRRTEDIRRLVIIWGKFLFAPVMASLLVFMATRSYTAKHTVKKIDWIHVYVCSNCVSMLKLVNDADIKKVYSPNVYNYHLFLERRNLLINRYIPLNPAVVVYNLLLATTLNLSNNTFACICLSCYSICLLILLLQMYKHNIMLLTRFMFTIYRPLPHVCWNSRGSPQ